VSHHPISMSNEKVMRVEYLQFSHFDDIYL